MGEGGFGVVWQAEQLEPVRREVALKIIKMGMNTDEVIARFEAERQSLALMHHPNIASVLDVGSTAQARPYFAMELVQGETISDYADRMRLSIADRLRLFTHVCEAFQHAHQKGIVHRDLKPSNVLVSVEQERAVPKVIDFGIAKAVGNESPTSRSTDEFPTLPSTNPEDRLESKLIGTPAYMSPEQLAGNTDVDTRADIYGLGGVLYQLLTGCPPRDPNTTGKDLSLIAPDTGVSLPSVRIGQETSSQLKLIAERRRTTSDALHRSLTGEIDWILSKAMHFDRAKRYDSASDLARDIERHLTHQPVSVAPPSAFYLARKFLRRNRFAAIAGSVVLLTSLVGAVSSTIGFLQAEAARKDMEFQWNRAEQQHIAAETAREEARLEADKALQFATTLEEMIGFADPSEGRGANFTSRDQLDEIEATIGTKFASFPLVEARLRRAVGRSYMNLHELPKAEPHLKRARAIRKNQLPPNDNLIAQSQVDWGWYLIKVGRYEEATKALTSVLPQLRANPSDDLITALAGLSRLNGRQENNPEREQLALEAWRVAQKLHGEEHAISLRYQARASRVKRLKGKYAEAESMCRDALRKISSVRPSDHPDVADIKKELARALLQRRKLTEAEQLAMDALAIDRAVKGEDDVYVLNDKILLIQILSRRNDRSDDALELAKDAAAHADRCEVSGAVDDYCRMKAYQLLATLSESSDTASCLDAARKSLAIQQRLPVQHGFVDVLRDLGSTLRHLGELDVAVECYREAVRGGDTMDAQERVGERFANHFFLADLLRETGELAGAKRELEVAISLTLPKRTHRRRISQTVAAFDYVELLALLDQTEKARTFLDQQSQSAKYDHFRQPTIDSILLVFDGQRLVLDEKFEKAESKFQQAISALPARRLGFGFFEHRIQRFIARCKQGRHEFDAAEEFS